MTELLRSGFSRLFKNKVFFWLCGFVTALCAVEIILQDIDNTAPSLDTSFFSFAVVLAICLAVFCSLFIGTEYSCGTVRNKLITGHRRWQIYISNFIVSSVMSIVLLAIWTAVFFSIGYVLLGAPVMTTTQFLSYLGIGTLTLIAYVALFVMLSVLIQNKAGAAVTCLVVVIAAFIVASLIEAKLSAPEFVSDYTMTASGFEELGQHPNPMFLTGTKREVYQFIFDLLPSCQSMQLAANTVINPIRLVICSVGLIFVTSLSGIFMFRKKDIK